jgi:hypothetical protein
MRDDSYLQSIMLYYNDDLTEAWKEKIIKTTLFFKNSILNLNEKKIIEQLYSFFFSL